MFIICAHCQQVLEIAPPDCTLLAKFTTCDRCADTIAKDLFTLAMTNAQTQRSGYTC